LKDFRFLAHDAFDDQCVEFLLTHPELSEQLATQLKKSVASPDSGRCLHEIPLAALQGKLFRLWVGGPQDYRYIYLFDSKPGVVVPVYISQVPRKKFDWDVGRFLQDASQIADDLEKGNTARFKQRVFPN
jgi:hypothetical protein